MSSNRLRLLLVSVMAVFAISAVASGSASAVEWQVCQKGGTENFKEHHCTPGTEESHGEWSWLPIAAGTKVPVESTGGEFKLEGAGNSSVCKHVTNTGEIEPGGKSKTSLVFTECTNGTGKCEAFAPAANDGTGTIDVSGITDQLVERGGKLADEFKENTTTHEFATIEFEVPGTEACAETPTTKVKGQVAGESNNITVAGQGETELIFPKPALVGNSLEAFGVKASLFGSANVFTSGTDAGWSVRAIKGPADVPQEFLNEKKEAVKSKKFSNSIASTTIEQAAEWKVVCNKGGALPAGEISGTTKIVKAEIFLEECTGTKLSEPEKNKTCPVKNTGGKANDIKIDKLTGELGEVAAAEATSEVGLLMKPEAGAKTWVEIEGTCIPHSPVTLEGELAAEVNQSLSKTGTLVFTPAGGEKGQKIKGIETSADVAVNPKFAGFAAAIVEVSSTLTNTFEEKVEATKGT